MIFCVTRCFVPLGHFRRRHHERLVVRQCFGMKKEGLLYLAKSFFTAKLKRVCYPKWFGTNLYLTSCLLCIVQPGYHETVLAVNSTPTCSIYSYVLCCINRSRVQCIYKKICSIFIWCLWYLNMPVCCCRIQRIWSKHRLQPKKNAIHVLMSEKFHLTLQVTTSYHRERVLGQGVTINI